MSKNKLGIIGLACVAMVLAACGQEGAVKAAKRPLPKADFMVVQTSSHTFTANLPGRTHPYRIAEVRPQVNGIIEKRLYDEGQKVQAGDPLYQIDDSLYRAAVESAQAQLASAKASLELAKATAQRSSDLAKRHLISQQENDKAQAALAQAKAGVQAAEAALQKARINLGYTTIRAPINGRIGRSNITAGALVTAGQAQALAVIRQLDPIYVDLTQPYEKLAQLRRALATGQLEKTAKGQVEVSLLLENGQPYAHKGSLQFSEYSVDGSTGSVTLRAVFPNPDGLLLPGMFVRAKLPQGASHTAILVPQKVVTIMPGGGSSVMLLGEGNKVVKQPVTIERPINGKWLISKGLQAGDKIIVDNLMKLRPGMTIDPIESGAKADKSADKKAATQDGTPQASRASTNAQDAA